MAMQATAGTVLGENRWVGNDKQGCAGVNVLVLVWALLHFTAALSCILIFI